MPHPIYQQVHQPTLLLNQTVARQNIATMAQKARLQQVRFRPHFKTHQSAEIGEWFREEGVNAITVSSLDMAAYFARHGWQDITLAFPINWRQVDDLRALTSRIHLGVLVESVASVQWLAAQHLPVDVWIKVDSGSHRTGIAWQQMGQFIQVISAAAGLNLCGLLTHAGGSYGAANPAAVYAESTARMLSLRDDLQRQTGLHLEVSVGDTPGCTLSPDLGGVDEIRPGNFVFFDAEQASFGSCSHAQIAVAAACPIVALHPERETVILYGGAIHLSKDNWLQNGSLYYGLVALPTDTGWSEPVPGAYVAALSQEHGILHVPAGQFHQFQIGELACILPAHSCLTAQALGCYLTLDGQWISMMPFGAAANP